MIFSCWMFRSSSVTVKLTTARSFMLRMSSRVWQHSSGKVGADWGQAPFSPTISSPSPMYRVLWVKICFSVRARSSGTDTLPSYIW